MNAALERHFRHPRRVGTLSRPDAEGRAGSVIEGRLIRLQLGVGADGTIADSAFQAYGCAATIACGSWLAERLAGTRPADAAALDSATIAAALTLPPLQIRCAVLAEQALRAALEELAERQRGRV